MYCVPKYQRVGSSENNALSSCAPITTSSSSDCSVECQEQNLTKGVGGCARYQLPLTDYQSNLPISPQPSTCPTISWTQTKPYVTPSVDSGGTIYYCADATLEGDAQPCTNVQSRNTYNTCNDQWAEFDHLDKGLNYAQYWTSSCEDFAEQLVRNGDYKSVACYNQSQTDFAIETGEYAQAWPSTGYNMSSDIWANQLACQLNPKYRVNDCQTMGNLCDTGMFTKDPNGGGVKMIETQSAPLVLETLEAVIEAIGEAL